MSLKDRTDNILGRKPVEMDIDGVHVIIRNGGKKYTLINDRGNQLTAKVEWKKCQNYHVDDDGWVTYLKGYHNELHADMHQGSRTDLQSFQGHITTSVDEDYTISEAFAKLKQNTDNKSDVESRFFNVIAQAGYNYHNEKDRPKIANRRVKEIVQGGSDKEVALLQKKKEQDALSSFLKSSVGDFRKVNRKGSLFSC